MAAWLDDEKRSGMEALRPFHRLNTPERIEAWKARFDNLDWAATTRYGIRLPARRWRLREARRRLARRPCRG